VNSQKIRTQIRKAISKMPTNGVVYREEENEFHEKRDKTKVCDVVGLKHSKRLAIAVSIEDAGQMNLPKQDYFMTEYSEQSQKIKEGDQIEIKGVSYEVQDLGNTLDLYFDMAIKRRGSNES
jgi:hypothetical protein